MSLAPPTEPLVSIVMILFDDERFLPAAIKSVEAQHYTNWELLLVDDGSTDASTTIAEHEAATHPERVRYLTHPGHENRGKSRSKNLGVDAATGDYVSYLAADDVWLPEKLERQVTIAAEQPEARIVFGPLRRWFSWTGDAADQGRDDFYGMHGDGATLELNRLYRPPELPAMFLEHEDLVPSGALFERALFHEVGGAEEPFRDLYEDAVLMVKMCLRASAYCADDSWYCHRQHLNRAWSTIEPASWRLQYLNWAAYYLAYQQNTDPVLQRAIRRGRRSVTRPGLHRLDLTARRSGRAARRALGAGMDRIGLGAAGPSTTTTDTERSDRWPRSEQ